MLDYISNPDAELVVPPWIAYARTKLGQHEVLGDKDNKYILSCHAHCGLFGVHDELAWCSSFVNDCMIVGAKLPGTYKANARSWLDYGIPLQTPVFGCIEVFTRIDVSKGITTPSPTLGHVNFFIHDFGDSHLGLGGNQGNEVSFDFYPVVRHLGYCWPKGYPLP